LLFALVIRDGRPSFSGSREDGVPRFCRLASWHRPDTPSGVARTAIPSGVSMPTRHEAFETPPLPNTATFVADGDAPHLPDSGTGYLPRQWRKRVGILTREALGPAAGSGNADRERPRSAPIWRKACGAVSKTRVARVLRRGFSHSTVQPISARPPIPARECCDAPSRSGHSAQHTVKHAPRWL